MRFKDDPQTMVLTTKRIINGDTIITIVFHDEADGMWQFLDGIDTDENSAAIISINEMVLIDPNLEEIANLPLGWVAWRNDSFSEWNMKVNA